MNSKFLITLLILTISHFSAEAMRQKISKNDYEIILRTNKETIRTWVSRGKKRVFTKPDRFYCGYYLNNLYFKQGELQGNPLNGEFKKYDLKDNIIESGNFKYGLKVGLWKRISPDGVLTETINYKQGLISGIHLIYRNGKPDTLERYRKGKLIGKPKCMNSTKVTKKAVDISTKKDNLFSRLFNHMCLNNPIKTKKTQDNIKAINNTTN